MYRLIGVEHASATLAEAAMQKVRGMWHRQERRDLWALKSVSFEVAEGEVVGVIGYNGAGKSTLLKLISRVTEPTEGEIRLRGSVGTLLEVGTGFHPELTGRENVFLNGAILGMARSEIRKRFDEIVEFADVGDFIDSPTKTYSSGMSMRLAFSVAAHLEAEILLVDEVLAVGDATFQEKCLVKIREVAQSGRTILLVSHNMPSVTRLCTRTIWLDKGVIVEQGDPKTVVGKYMKGASQKSTSFHAGDVFRLAKPAKQVFETAEPKQIDISLSSIEGVSLVTVCFVDESGVPIVDSDSLTGGLDLRAGSKEMQFVLRSPRLRPGDYRVDLFAVDFGGNVIDTWHGACHFGVEAYGAEQELIVAVGSSGVVLSEGSWSYV